MFEFHKYRVLAVGISLVLLVSACGPSAQSDSAISTAVAQTVQAGQSLTKIAAPTNTPEPTPIIDGTPASVITPTSAPTLVSAPADPNCARAELVGEDPPDGKIFRPGEYFWKTWTLKNTGTCTWNRSYSLIFWSGDLLGGLTSYPLDDEVSPNETKSISIYLKTPDNVGSFTGYWRLQSPWNANFGVGPYDEPFYVNVVTSTDRRPDYGVTDISFQVVRDPVEGCPRNVRYNVYATITVSGPYEFSYQWLQSDDNPSGIKPVVMEEAGTMTVTREWMVGRGDSPKPKWMTIVVTEPEYQEFEKVEIPDNCP
jgi:hypothetical protein